MVERNSLPDVMRRTVGLSPSYADGVLICPAGPVVAVDLATHSLLWGFRGGSRRRPQFLWAAARHVRRHGKRRRRLRRRTMDRADGDGGGRPRFGHLPPGRRDLLLEPCRRQAAVEGAGETGRALPCLRPCRKCRDRPPQRLVRAPPGRRQTGVGPRPCPRASSPAAAGSTRQPLFPSLVQSAEAAVVDLDAGKIIQISKSREGRVPGNLVYSQGKGDLPRR